VRTGREDIGDEQIASSLHGLGLESVLERMGGLDVERDWDDALSLGEQQLLFVARVVLATPRFVLERPRTALGSEQVDRILSLLSERPRARGRRRVDLEGGRGRTGRRGKERRRIMTTGNRRHNSSANADSAAVPPVCQKRMLWVFAKAPRRIRSIKPPIARPVYTGSSSSPSI